MRDAQSQQGRLCDRQWRLAERESKSGQCDTRAIEGITRVPPRSDQQIRGALLLKSEEYGRRRDLSRGRNVARRRAAPKPAGLDVGYGRRGASGTLPPAPVGRQGAACRGGRRGVAREPPVVRPLRLILYSGATHSRCARATASGSQFLSAVGIEAEQMLTEDEWW